MNPSDFSKYENHKIQIKNPKLNTVNELYKFSYLIVSFLPKMLILDLKIKLEWLIFTKNTIGFYLWPFKKFNKSIA